MKYQRDLAKIKDERATFYRSAENESLKLVVRLNAADQKVYINNLTVGLVNYNWKQIYLFIYDSLRFLSGIILA